MDPLHHRLTKMSIPKAQSVGMTAFQRGGITASFNYFRDKTAQSVGTTGTQGFSLQYRAPGRQYSRGEGRPGGGGSALKRRSPTVITILKHTRKLYYCNREQLERFGGITGYGSRIKNRFYYIIYYGQTQL